MKKNEKKFNEYVDLLSKKECFTKVYANKNEKNANFISLNSSKKYSIEALKDYSKNQNIELDNILLFAFAYNLSRYSGTNELLFLTNIDNDYYPFYLNIDCKNIEKLLKKVVDTKNLIKNFTQELLTVQDKILETDNIIKFSINNDNNVFNFDFNFKLSLDNQLNIGIIYDNSKYDKTLIKNILDSFYLILDSITKCNNLSDINYLTKKDLNLLDKINNNEISIEEKNIPSMLKKQVIKNKNKIAIIDDNNQVTYEELDKLSNKIGNTLLEENIKLEDIVMIMLDRTIYATITRIGIIKSGGAFLNVLPDYPLDRIKYILDDSNAKFIITNHNIYNKRNDLFDDFKNKVIFIEDVIQNGKDDEIKLKIPKNNLCYTIFTSGSTGKPKGVQIEHGNLINYCHVNKYNYEAKTITDNICSSIALASLTFDVSILEEFIPLLNGGTVVIASEDEIFNPIKLAKLMKKNNVEAITCTPSFISSILDIKEIKDAFKELKSDKNITIGKPMANTKIYMVNKKHEILPIDVPGELAIMSNGVSRGYLKLPEINKEKFIKINGKRTYLSGDLARWNRNGEIEFLGRIDNQIKINGYRIELSEIEEVINSYKNVNSCITRVIEKENQKYICAYFTAQEKIDIQELKTYVSKLIPEYMIPKKMIQLDEFPLNANGKVDRKLLPIPEDNLNEYIEPKTNLEIEICNIIKDILKKDKIGSNDNFFEIGGNSLNVMKLITKANNNGITIEYKDIFNYPIIKDLARYLTNDKTENKNIVSDYEKVNNIIKNNTLSELIKAPNNHEKVLKNIIVSGGTGFLGIHVIHELLLSSDYADSKIYALVRKGKFNTIEERINYLFDYYFNENFECYKKHLTLVEGDITDMTSFNKLDGQFDAFINCAALVKYYDAKNQIEKVNVEGVKNIMNYCLNNNIMLVQISTTSVGGTKNVKENNYKFGENILYFGQNLDNKYAKTKFEAEENIIKAMANGLKAKIIRIGNLMPRYNDYQFQINYNDNGFMNMLKAFVILKCIPISLFTQNIELSPVDKTAKSILKLINNDDNFNLYHSFNNNSIYYYDIVHAMKEYGFNIKIVSDEEFNKILNNRIKNNDNVEQFIGLYADLASDSKKELQEVDAKNIFTTELLYSLGFKWPLITNDYLKNIFKKLDELKYFQEQIRKDEKI